MMTREEMMEYIQERLEEAGDLEIEEFYWFVVCEMGGRQKSTNFS